MGATEVAVVVDIEVEAAPEVEVGTEVEEVAHEAVAEGQGIIIAEDSKITIRVMVTSIKAGIGRVTGEEDTGEAEVSFTLLRVIAVIYLFYAPC